MGVKWKEEPWNPTGTGYRAERGGDHPATWRNGVVSEHRKVLYDKIGPGPHPCHWCKRELRWDGPTGTGKLYVDHLDFDRLNNAAENLVPSCMQCNIHRTPAVRKPRPRKRRTHCKQGHALVEGNVYQFANGNRICRRCSLDWQKRRRELTR